MVLRVGVWNERLERNGLGCQKIGTEHPERGIAYGAQVEINVLNFGMVSYWDLKLHD